MRIVIGLALAILGFTPPAALAADAPAVASPADYILLTIFLRHDQSKTLDELQAEQERNQFWQTFPPEGIAIESWYVMMGIGQVVTLRVPPARLREVNRAIERTAWGPFRTEFYPTYDLEPVARAAMEKARATSKQRE